MAGVAERAAVRRLVERLGFGPRPGELDTLAGQGFGQAAAGMMSIVDDKGAAPPSLDGDPKKDREALRGQQSALTIWWLDRMVGSESQLLERMTWFWHGHFATSVQKVRSPKLMLTQNQTLRHNGLGDFAVLAKAMAVDPAMLIWLDGQKNTAKAANENLGRELMELFTLGIGQYSEQDVKEAARALTGWKVNRDTGTATLAPKQHDEKEKTVLGRAGNLDAPALVDILVAQPASPRFVAQHLWTRLVSTNPPDDAALGRLTAAYGANRNVRALLQAIINEPAFRDQASTLVKQPVDWAVGLMRALKIRPAALPEADKTKLLAGLRGMGQVPFQPPSVGGWPSGTAWLTTSAGLSRLQLARLLAGRAELTSISGDDSVTAVGHLLGVDGWSERTSKALSTVAHAPDQLVAVAATAPEYVVSG
jgi:uncharacterized protein (DUF1800 family)